mmetsp:Transcript_14409/g.23700  ORF Transcript_14409/g.23700 Transcript_14409/m.23700 type:complete len:206 (+) Transcript_14409:284-901(+)|eukprot:CAMPEP_0198698748 /NCGR_PEP_ID=MMETSP1468-20131203/342876_1 /TAXON_ID=1461545 /ORGANISM="Mantoniella sp, Strain CCMP1436" /LENGTH=205 /DNA_ID=CAMNT_0044455957 /DNA_START=282 /DNA_END=899 /DNA_ORIENTATION=+
MTSPVNPVVMSRSLPRENIDGSGDYATSKTSWFSDDDVLALRTPGAPWRCNLRCSTSPHHSISEVHPRRSASCRGILCAWGGWYEFYAPADGSARAATTSTAAPFAPASARTAALTASSRCAQSGDGYLCYAMTANVPSSPASSPAAAAPASASTTPQPATATEGVRRLFVHRRSPMPCPPIHTLLARHATRARCKQENDAFCVY